MIREIHKSHEHMQSFRQTLAISLGALVLTSSCSSESSSPNDCTSSTEVIAKAPTLHQLKSELAEEYDADSFFVGEEDGERFINPLNKRGRLIVNLNLDRNKSGNLVASQWHQCID